MPIVNPEDTITEEQQMLILARKQNQSIIIDSRITIKVVQIRGNTVRLGIEAPREVAVHREEVHRRLAELKEAGVA